MQQSYNICYNFQIKKQLVVQLSPAAEVRLLEIDPRHSRNKLSLSFSYNVSQSKAPTQIVSDFPAIFAQISAMTRKYILDAETANMKLLRMAYEIIENNLEEQSIILVGIKDNGSIIARSVEKILKEASDIEVAIIDLELDKRNPGEIKLSNKTNLDGKVIIIVDDVASSGKTMLYALKPFLDFHPKKIQTLALVERTHKAFPVNLDYVGLSVATTLHEHIYVTVEGDRVSGAYL